MDFPQTGAPLLIRRRNGRYKTLDLLTIGELTSISRKFEFSGGIPRGREILKIIRIFRGKWLDAASASELIKASLPAGFGEGNEAKAAEACERGDARAILRVMRCYRIGVKCVNSLTFSDLFKMVDEMNFLQQEELALQGVAAQGGIEFPKENSSAAPSPVLEGLSDRQLELIREGMPRTQ